MNTEKPRFFVKYYDAKLSKKGRGTQYRWFRVREEAEKFASENKIYAAPSKVEEVSQ